MLSPALAWNFEQIIRIAPPFATTMFLHPEGERRERLEGRRNMAPRDEAIRIVRMML